MIHEIHHEGVKLLLSILAFLAYSGTDFHPAEYEQNDTQALSTIFHTQVAPRRDSPGTLGASALGGSR
jgi:hypothetical protein